MKGYAGVFSLMEIMQSSGVRSQLLHHLKNRFVAKHSMYSLDHILIYEQGTLPFMSRHLIRALELGHNALHTPVDDLESYLWVLVWSVTHILKWAAGAKMTNEKSIINQLAKCLSSRYIHEILAREDTLAYEWKETVFGGLLRDWLYISQRSRIKLNDLQDTLLLQDSLGNVAAREQGLNCIEEHCVGVYKDFMKAGYKHYQTIRLCEDWTKVVDLNVGVLNR
jgi:hypothetical protein